MLKANVPLASIALIGRWLSDRSMREYLRRGEVAQLRLRKDVVAGTWERIDELALIGEHVWQELPACATHKSVD